MKPDMFDKPVKILLGLGIPTEVNSVMHAYQILMEWRNQHDPARELALKACRAALIGDIDAQTARAVFVAFAERHDLLAPETGGLLAERSKRSSDPHIR
ncbi:DUF982 domain-containing protein [Pararhizobium qamdonense]|uniref:DUF982 domain-containing protein n=1 Tax=Pararhizobium qamdonense TaxID=3031126 RepID=UPI0023E1F10D|nr:DUF982 domain-containing protein [Pararhizobium qamdonense]